MGSQGPGRKRIPNRNGLTAEEDALNVIAREAEARLAAKRAARAEAREIRMKELERQQKEVSDDDEQMSVRSRSSLQGSSQASALSTATLTSLGSCRGSGDSTVTANTETSMQEIKEIHELKDQIQDVESKYMQNLREVKDSLVEMEEKYRKAMVSNAQLDNEKTNLMYQVDTLKDSLIQLEELLAETRRESEDKSKHLEREKHAYSVLQFQFNELKETLKQSEELLTEIRQLQFKQDGFVREISDLQETIDWKNKKIGALERQKEYCDAIRNERDELRDEVVQLKDILKKHGIVLGPDLSTNKEAGEDVADGSGSAIKEGSSVLGPQEFQLGRDGNVKSYREDQDQKSKDLDHEMQNNLPHPHALSVAENNDGGLVNAFRSQNENSGVFESRGVISKSQFEDKVKTNDVVLQDLKDSVPLMKGTSTPDQVESSVSVKINEVIKEESPESTNYACEVHLSSQENMGIAQDKNVFEGLTKIDKNAPCSQSVCSSSKKKKKKKKKKQKQSCEKKENSTAQQRESDPECISEFGEASEDVSVNENVKTNLNNEEKMDPENKDKLQSPTSKIDTVTRELSEAVSQNQQDLADCMTKSDFISPFNASKIKTDQDIPTDDFQKQITIGCVKASECDHLLDIPPSIGNIESKVMSNINDPFSVESSLCDIHSVCSSNMSSDCLGFHNSSSNIENPFVVKNEREISKKENYLVENKKDSQVIQLDETCVHEFQYDEVEKKLIKDENTTQGHITSTWPEDVQYGGDHNKKKAHLEVSGDSELNTIEEISLDTGVSVTPSVDKRYMDTTPVQRPVEEDEYQGHAYTLQGPKVVEHEIREECEESLEFHDMDLEASSGVIPQYVSVEQEKEVIWSKGKLHEDNEQQNGNRPQELIGGQSKDVDQVPEMDEQDSESHEGEEQTMDRDRCVTEEQQTVTEEQCGHEIQGITENDEARSKDHQELKDTESNAGANDESTKNLQDIDDPLLETEDLAMKSSVLLT